MTTPTHNPFDESHSGELLAGKPPEQFLWGGAGDGPGPTPAPRQSLTRQNRCHYIIDWNYDEDRGRIRTGHGPENITRLRRFAVALILCKPGRRAAETMRRLNRNVRTVFDYLLMSENSRRTPAPAPA
ncbi:MAG: hypothetical protein ACYCUE_10915 [Steroidobacteraceae bacterium]